MEKKSLTRPKFSNSLRTAVSARIRSKPSAESQRYLDLYGLQRERLRWSRMKAKSEQMIEDIEKALSKLGFALLKDAPAGTDNRSTTAEAGSRARTKTKRCA